MDAERVGRGIRWAIMRKIVAARRRIRIANCEMWGHESQLRHSGARGYYFCVRCKAINGLVPFWQRLR